MSIFKINLREKRIKEIEKRVKNYISKEVFLTKQRVEYVDFYIKNSDDSLHSARCLYDISIRKDYHGYENLNGFLWVIM